MTNGSCDGPECHNQASRYAMDMDGKPAELCELCFTMYSVMVMERKMEQPFLKCHTCGKKIDLTVAEFSKTMEMLDNRNKKRAVDPIYTCLNCKVPRPLGWATLPSGRVLFSWSEKKREKSEEKTEEGEQWAEKEKQPQTAL